MARIAKQNIREKIVEAAERRLWYYGIKKTTIDEIASDAGVGKGTVYLYFDSKEDICLAIFVGYKQGILREQEVIAGDPSRSTLCKIEDFLLLPVLTAQTKCQQHPEAVEIISVLKPHLAEHMRPYAEEEIRLLTQIIVEGNDRGVLCVPDPHSAAHALKQMTTGFFPPYPYVVGPEETEKAIRAIVSLSYRGLRCQENGNGTEAGKN